MNSEIYKKSIEYEILTKTIYQSLLVQEGVKEVLVEHNTNLCGRSGVEHQIDVYWKFTQAMIEHVVLIECKHYSTAVTLEKVRNFHSILNDIGNCKGIMVTKVGYQSGVKKYADYYGIDLKLIRKPIEEDWVDRVKTMHINLIEKIPASSKEKPISISVLFSPESEDQKIKIDILQRENRWDVPSGPDMCLLDKNAVPSTDEMRWWLPRQLEVLNKKTGGPYEQNIQLTDKYILVNPDSPDQQLVKIVGMKVIYWVEEYNISEIVIQGEKVVNAILKDFSTNRTEYIHRNEEK